MIIGYDANLGNAIPDAWVGEELERWIGEEKGPIYSTENIITAYRVALRQKKINNLTIQFYKNGVYQEDIFVHPSSGASSWPEGYCDTIEKLLMELL